MPSCTSTEIFAKGESPSTSVSVAELLDGFVSGIDPVPAVTVNGKSPEKPRGTSIVTVYVIVCPALIAAEVASCALLTPYEPLLPTDYI